LFTPCEAVHQPVQLVLSIRTRCNVDQLSELVGPSYDRIMAYLQELGEQPAGVPFVAYYNLDLQNLDMEIGFPVARELPGKGDIQPRAIPEGTYATTLYTGPYPGLSAVYEALTEFVKSSGQEPSGISYEYYLNSSMDTTPEDLQTRVSFPLKG
jgi:effector-binding domain-containing protein